jgi:hypothetical protein
MALGLPNTGEYKFVPAKSGGGTSKGGRGASGRSTPKPKPVSSGRSSSSRSTPTYHRSSTRSGGAAQISHNPVNRPAKPILPIPSADAIAELFSQIAGFKRDYNTLGVNAGAQKKELGAARGLFLQQLLAAFQRNRTSALEDFASRGLADSGIQNEALARLQNEYNGQRSEYETNYTSQVDNIMRQLQQRRGDLLAQRGAAERRYNQLRAQRASALRAAGYGG